MADEEHLKILQQGVEVWNKWREENPNLDPDLVGAVLSEVPIRRIALLHGETVRTIGASQRMDDLALAGYRGISLCGANLNSVDLREANLTLPDLTEADLTGAQLWDASLIGAKLVDAELVGADLSAATLIGADLHNANLNLVNFVGARFDGSDLTQSLMGNTVLCNVDLSMVNGLDLVAHEFPSSIGVDTLAINLRGSGGRFTQEQLIFFESAGVPATLLEYLPGMLEDNPVQFFSCFISYSTRDEGFAERLNQDLNRAGIKTRKWDRDAVRGRDLGENIDRAIRTHHKTILVCSVNSLTSPQVEREVQEALDKEVQIKTANAERRREALARGERPPTVDADVLVPIRLDDTIFNWDSHLKGEVTRRMISDFIGAPPGSSSYHVELQKLIQALNPRSWPPQPSRATVSN